jgi:hypothetical protein
MLKIFAKHGTDEKVLAACDQGSIHKTIIALNDKFGGSWVFVDKVRVYEDEVVKFQDGLIYRGFETNKNRYCKAIEKLKR